MKKLQDIYYRYRGFARQPYCMVGTIDYFSYGKKVFFMQIILMDPAMLREHGCRAKAILKRVW